VRAGLGGVDGHDPIKMTDPDVEALGTAHDLGPADGQARGEGIFDGGLRRPGAGSGGLAFVAQAVAVLGGLKGAHVALAHRALLQEPGGRLHQGPEDQARLAALVAAAAGAPSTGSTASSSRTAPTSRTAGASISIRPGRGRERRDDGRGA
jgi:hypothetical protein